MVKRITAVLAAVLIISGSLWAQNKSGTISSNQTWSGTITIVGNVTIQNAVVTISPGTQVKFATSPTNMTIAIKTNGAIKAVGTAASPILFTTSYPIKNRGLWSEIDIFENINVSQTTFKHCVFECGGNALDFRSSDHDRIKATSAITIENCEIRKMQSGGAYITSGGCPTFRNCVIHDCYSSGLFAHGAGTVTVQYVTIYNVSVGLNSSGEPNWGWTQTMNVDHVTIHHIDGNLATTDKWWTGFGVYCSGDYSQRGTINLTNTIVSDVTFTQNDHTISGGPIGIQFGKWTESNDYLCIYTPSAKDMTGGSPGSHSIEADPKFISTSDPTLGLQASSPCIGTGSGGSTIGAYTGSTPVWADVPRENPALDLEAGPNPFNGVFLIRSRTGEITGGTIYNEQGEMVRRLSPAEGQCAWDGKDGAGRSCPAGMYIYVVATPQGESQGCVVIR